MKKTTGTDRSITSRWRPQTRAVRAGTWRSEQGETSEALFLTSGYAYDDAETAAARFRGEDPGMTCSRLQNPTVAMLEERIASLEGAALVTALVVMWGVAVTGILLKVLMPDVRTHLSVTLQLAMGWSALIWMPWIWREISIPAYTSVRLEKLVAATRKRGVRVQAELRAGRPWMEILNVAREHGVEAICLGNSGRSLFERLLLGSTAENVIRRSTVPVLVTRDRSLAKVRRVLVPVAFDEGSKQALRVVRGAFPERTAVRAIHVMVPVSAFDPMMGIVVPDEASTAEELRDHLGQKTLGKARLEVRVATDLTSGVLDHGREEKADLVVISTHGRRGLAGRARGHRAAR